MGLVAVFDPQIIEIFHVDGLSGEASDAYVSGKNVPIVPQSGKFAGRLPARRLIEAPPEKSGPSANRQRICATCSEIH
jgi:hypothetical protein